jgi:hypothetical protein
LPALQAARGRKEVSSSSSSSAAGKDQKSEKVSSSGSVNPMPCSILQEYIMALVEFNPLFCIHHSTVQLHVYGALIKHEGHWRLIRRYSCPPPLPLSLSLSLSFSLSLSLCLGTFRCCRPSRLCFLAISPRFMAGNCSYQRGRGGRVQLRPDRRRLRSRFHQERTDARGCHHCRGLISNVREPTVFRHWTWTRSCAGA